MASSLEKLVEFVNVRNILINRFTVMTMHCTEHKSINPEKGVYPYAWVYDINKLYPKEGTPTKCMLRFSTTSVCNQ